MFFISVFLLKGKNNIFQLYFDSRAIKNWYKKSHLVMREESRYALVSSVAKVVFYG